jgi:plastocyanin domain-containing protein
MRKSLVLLPALLLAAGCTANVPSRTEVRVTVTDDGFEPRFVTVAKGRPATLVITRKVQATCATEAVFAGTGARFPLPLNQDVRIPIATATAETLHYACGMDMYHAAVVVK